MPLYVTRDRRMRRPNFQPACSAPETPPLETYRQSGGIQRVQGWYAVDNQQSMYVELQLH